MLDPESVTIGLLIKASLLAADTASCESSLVIFTDNSNKEVCRCSPRFSFNYTRGRAALLK
jgi:hypothetical protein